MARFTITGPQKETEYKTVVAFVPEYGGPGYARSPQIKQARDAVWNNQIYGEVIFDLTGVQYATTSALIEAIDFLNQNAKREVSIRASEQIAIELEQALSD